MTDLHEHFAAIADEAKHYDVGNSVIRVARRRQRMVRLAPVAVAAAAALAVAAVWVPLTGRSGGDSVTGVDAAGPAGRAVVDWIPDKWTVPTSALPLPADRPVGAGALVYAPCPATRERCPDNFLLTRSGEQYKLPGELAGLSPDGRWLVSGPEGARTLRDLTGTGSRPLGDVTVAAWSPDGGLLVLEPNAPGVNPASVTVMTLASGQSRQVPIHDPDDWAVRDVFPSGDLLLVPRRDYDRGGNDGTPMPSLTGPDRSGGDPGFFLAVADGVTGEQRGLDVPLTGDALAEGEQISTGPAMPLVIDPAGRTLYYQLIRDGSSPIAGDLLALSTKGEVLERYRLPAGRDAGERRLLAVREEGVLLAAHRAGVLTVELLDPDSGERQVVATAPADCRVLLPGTVSWQMM
jgi:hypothetical protein